MIRLLNIEEIESVSGGLYPPSEPKTLEDMIKDVLNPVPNWDDLICW